MLDKGMNVNASTSEALRQMSELEGQQIGASVAQLRRAGIAGVVDYEEKVRSNIGSVLEVCRGIQAEAQEKWLKLSTDLFKPNEASLKAADETLRKAELLGRFGWTLPMQMTARHVYTLLNIDDPGRINECFVDFYTINDSKRDEWLRNELLSSPLLEPWRELLIQCCNAYRREEFLITVPSLLLVLEGSLAKPENDKLTGEHRKAFFGKKLRPLSENGMDRFIWRSVETFFDWLYEFRRFDSARPSHINRHWILHGRDIPDWDRADCLRLFQALQTISCVT